MTIVGGTWTYSGNPATDEKDAVRFLIGDTDGARQLISDEEILWALDDVGNRYGAAAICCRIIGSDVQAAGKVTVGDMSQEGARDAHGWMELAERYEQRAVIVASPPTPFFGGESISRRRDVAADSDRRSPIFYRNQFTRTDQTAHSTAGPYWREST